jgi:hypothetical protein
VSPKPVMQLGGITLIVIAVLLAARTGTVAVFLGATPGTGIADVTNQSWLPFWFQLTFMRLFATALAGLGAIFLWSASRLSSDQLRSLGRLAALVLCALGLTALAQQIAIWNSTSGWLFTGLFISLTIMCGFSSARPLLRH